MKKRVSQQYLDKVGAVELVGPTQKRLSEWSEQCAFISAIALAGRGDTAAVALQVDTMIDAIDREREALLHRVADRPEPIRNHSRVLDAVRSLDALKAKLREALGRLRS